MGLFMKMYGLLSHLDNDSIRMYLKLFSITDANQRRLFRSKMLNIFKPGVRRNLNMQSSDTSQGIFGGDSRVLKSLEDQKKMSTLLKSALL